MAPFPLHTALAIGLGANVRSCHGPPEATLRWIAPRLIDWLLTWGDVDSCDVRCSSFVTTEPIGGPSCQNAYGNAVILLTRVQRPASLFGALELLEHLQGLEQSCGRARSREQRWGPRSLDLDLLFWGELRLEHPDLILPHPRMHLRSFVLDPLLQAMQGTHPPCW